MLLRSFTEFGINPQLKNLILLFTSFSTMILSPYFKFFLCMRLYRMFYKAFKGINVHAIVASQFLHLMKIIMIYSKLYPIYSDTNINAHMSFVFMLLGQCHWCLQLGLSSKDILGSIAKPCLLNILEI